MNKADIKELVCLAVLAHGQSDDGLDESTKQRIERAVELASSYQSSNQNRDKLLVWVVFMAGMGKNKTKDTMASSMQEYARAIAKRKGFEIPMYANHEIKEVWGTVREMGWARKLTVDIPNCRLVFVTNRRHGRRVLLTNFLLHNIPKCTVEHSFDEPPPWWHEALAYLKLGACLLGLGVPAEAFRRKYYTR